MNQVLMSGLDKLIFIFFFTFIIGSCKVDRYENIDPINIDCNKKKELLNTVYTQDQEMRKSMDLSKIDEAVDLENLITVISIIENCGFPKKSDVGKKGLDAVWLVIQHSSEKWITKYLPRFKELAISNEIDWQAYAMMEDGLLMLQGLPQKFGTQIQNGDLYLVDNLDSVKVRREKYGFEDLEIYLNRFK